MEIAKIYALIDPRTDEIRYVGRTIQDLQNRLRQHLYKSKKKKHARAKWICELRDLNLRPWIELLEEVPNKHSLAYEKRWTRKLLDEGFDLLNEGIGRGGCVHPAKRIVWTPELDALLGKIGDSRIAEKIGCSRKSVTYRREKLGIPAAYDRTRNIPPPPMGGHNKIELPDEIIKLLGAMADNKLAKKAGVSKKRIMVARHKRGIPSWSEVNGHPTRYKEGNYPERWL